MAVHLNGSNQRLFNSSAIGLSAYPVSVLIRFNPDTNHDGTLWSLSDSGSANDYLGLIIRDPADNDCYAIVRQGGTYNLGITSNSYSTSSWQTAMGVFEADGAVTCVLNGDWANRGTDSANTVAWDTGYDYTIVGGLRRSGTTGLLFDGAAAEVAVYKGVALGQADAEAFQDGYSPELIQPGYLWTYWRLGGFGPEDATDKMGRYDLTEANSPTYVDHPPVIYPSPALWVPASVAAPPTFGGRNKILGGGLLSA